MNLLEENTSSGLEQLQAWIAAGRQPPIGETMQFRLVEVEKGRAVFEGTPGKHVYNPIGVVHGGYAATLLDSACGCAVHASLSGEQAYTTLELKVAYHRALNTTTGAVRAEGKVISIGKRVAFAEGRITDASGKLYASATSTLLVMDRNKA
ncbi:MAG TPA: PaaI family thioesterase [Nevskiaceae bacterium]|nr:PaaI family thioesterase [Nevskiaceae bacterium]